MLSYTGHPLLDIGVATLGAFVGKRDPSELTPSDLAKAADYMEQNYVVEPLKSFLTVAFPNSGFTQPAYERHPHKRSEYARRVLRAYESAGHLLNVPCAFTGSPALGTSLDTRGRLPPGRAFRQHVPILTSEGVVNFHPNGQAGLPISGEALLAFQALPLGCAKVGGRVLAVHADAPQLTYAFTEVFLRRNLEAIQVAQQRGHSKMPEYEQRAKTLVIDTLLEVGTGWLDSQTPPVSVSAYHFSNSGTGVRLDIYHLPMEVFRFLQVVRNTPSCRSTWDSLCLEAWRTQRAHLTGKAIRRFNAIYEGLFQLPDGASPFVRRHLLGLPLYGRRPELVNPQLSDVERLDLVSWDLAELFLERVVRMHPARLQRIRSLGDSLAQYVRSRNAGRMLREIVGARSYAAVRSVLLLASAEKARLGQPPLVTADTWRDIFECSEGLPYSDWPLARDLVLIRLIEQLHRSGWLEEHSVNLPSRSKAS